VKVGVTRKMSPTSVIAFVVVLIVSVVAGTATLASASQSPANCNENDFILQLKQDPGPTYAIGQTINYSARTGNTDPSAAGCDIDNVTTTLTTPDGVVHTLQTGGVYPFPTAVTQVGATVPYVVSAADEVAGPCGNVTVCPVIIATAKATGTLHDDPVQDDPFSVQKQVSGPVGVQQQLHYLCYEAKRAPIAIGNVSVVDQFGANTVAGEQLHRLCNPTNKRDEDPSAVNSPNHLDGYEASSKGNPAQGHKIAATNQFGTTNLQLQQVRFVFVPSAKSLTGPVGPLASPGDRYVCYVVKTVNFPKIAGVKVQDEFGTMTIDLTDVNYFCDPANVNGHEPGAETHTNHLMCYEVGTHIVPPNTWVNDEFQARQVKLDGHLDEFCVPSTKKVLS